MNRLQGIFGDTGVGYGRPMRQGRLEAYAAIHRFESRSYSIVLWAATWAEAEDWARRHGLVELGKLYADSTGLADGVNEAD